MNIKGTLLLILFFVMAGVSSPVEAKEVVLTNDDSRCVVDTYGARIRSFKIGEEELLWDDPVNRCADNVEWIHGGIPITWPWFGRIGEGDANIHGYVWKNEVLIRSKSADELVMTFSTEIADLEYRIRLEKLALSLELKSISHSRFPFAMGVAFHPYFRVGERDRTIVTGFGNAPLYCTNTIDSVCMYDGAVTKREYFIRDKILKRTIQVTASGSTGVNVWNPGPEKECPGVIPGEEWRHFFAVEPFAQGETKLFALAPGETHILSMRVSLLK